MDEMDKVFALAKEKAVSKINPEKGYTAQPWIDFSPKRLQDRLNEEYKEFLDAHPSNDKEELLDVINLAIFLYLSREEFPFKKENP